jgi:hypothetical protein
MVAAMSASAVASLSAQGRGFTASGKVRAGVTSGDLQQDLRANKMTGMGIEFAYAFGGRSSLFGEVAYVNFASTDYWNPLPAGAVAASSVDLRKNRLGGFTLRGGYRSEFGSTGLSWQAGLALDRLKSRQEVSGQILIGTTTEGLAVTPESTKANVGGFGGIHWAIGENFSLEANLVSVGYSQVNWVPSSYSGTAAAAETKSHRGVVFEVAFGFKF